MNKPEVEWTRKAKVEISIRVDEAAYAEFYGDDVTDETLHDAIAEVNTVLRHAFQARTGALRLPWFEARVGRVIPVPEAVPDLDAETP